ncbi:MAG TPA: tetratricopeptide repeat protein [Vicinamibacterales bacterium]|nr:tetratricopeptide repeat protein [Vicinamibacterales bacterium]
MASDRRGARGAIVRAAGSTIALWLAIGCRPPARPPLHAVSLPDLSRAAESVEAQLRERYASLTSVTANPRAPAGELADAFGTMGMLLMAAEYRDAAEACLLNAEALAPDAARWPYYLAHLYKAGADHAKAEAEFERVLRLQPRNVSALVWLGDAFLDEGRPEAAQPLFERARAEDPQSIAALVGLGRAALARSDYAHAVDHLERALAIDPREAAIHYQLAMAYRGLGQQDKADAHMRLRRPGTIRPSDPLMSELATILESPVAYEVRGATALDHGDFTAAATYFRKGLDLAPGEPSLHHKLGTALYMSGDPRGAANEFAEALRLSPTFAKAHYSLGVMLAGDGRTADALAHLSAAVRADPAYAEARVRLADLLRRSGRAAESLSAYAEAAALDSRAPDAPLGYALALVDLHRYREARDRLREDVQQYPDAPAFVHALVRLLSAAPDATVRDGQQALVLMQGVLAREPRGVEVCELMAMTQAELGQYGEAVTWQREALAAAERLSRPDIVRRLTETLARYEHRQPCRTLVLDEASTQ